MLCINKPFLGRASAPDKPGSVGQVGHRTLVSAEVSKIQLKIEIMSYNYYFYADTTATYETKK